MVQFGINTWANVDNHYLPWEEHLIYLILHLRKHIMGEGSGIRQFLDIAMIIQNRDLDWNKISKSIVKLDLTAFFQKVLQFIEYVFNVHSPLTLCTMQYDDAEYILNKLFSDGIFGHYDNENKKNYTANEASYKGIGYLIRRFFSAVFLPLKEMQRMKEYNYLGKKPFLLPWAWFMRMIRKLANVKHIKDEHFGIGEHIQKRNTLFQIWGIIHKDR